MRDLSSEINPRPVIAPQVATDNTPMVGTAIDRQGFDSLTFVMQSGTIADSDATVTPLVEHADDDGTGVAGAYTAVPDDQLVGTEALAGFVAADDNKCRKIGYVGDKRFVRLTATPAANSGNLPFAAVAILGHASIRPTANPPV